MPEHRKGTRRKIVTVSIDEDIWRKARDQNISISGVTEKALKEIIPKLEA